MSKIEVQGVVSVNGTQPLVQIRVVDDEGVEEKGFQLIPTEARDLAHTIIEAAANAIYEAAIIQWAKEKDHDEGEMIGISIIEGLRGYRADHWGLPSPEDWSK